MKQFHNWIAHLNAWHLTFVIWAALGYWAYLIRSEPGSKNPLISSFDRVIPVKGTEESEGCK